MQGSLLHFEKLKSTVDGRAEPFEPNDGNKAEGKSKRIDLQELLWYRISTYDDSGLILKGSEGGFIIRANCGKLTRSL
jgi:hypothetical protein